MIKKFRTSPIAVTVMLLASVALISTDKAWPQEVSSGSLLLQRTYIKAESTGIHFGEIPNITYPAFTTTKVKCPAPNLKCTIFVEFSVQFENIRATNGAGAVIMIDNSRNGVLPGSGASGLTGSVTPIGPLDYRTASWMKKDLSPGDHTVDVGLYSFGAQETGADALNRTVKIEVYVQLNSRNDRHGDAEE